MNRMFASCLTIQAAILFPTLAAAGVFSPPPGCVAYAENCPDDTTPIGFSCGDGDHGAPKEVSMVFFGPGVSSATLTSCKEGETVLITYETDLCMLPPFNDNVCNVELVLDSPTITCPAEPMDVCTAFGEDSSLKITDKSPDTKDKLLVKMQGGPALLQEDFGEPDERHSYALCIYDGDALEVTAFMHADSLRWKRSGSTGWSYKGAKNDPSGVKKAKLKGGDASSILILRKGIALPPLYDSPVGTVQVISNDGDCFEMAF